MCAIWRRLDDSHPTTENTLTAPLDALDRTVIAALRSHPRASITELAKRARVARGTLYSRLERLEDGGTIVGYGPELDPAAAGYGVVGFVTLEIAQGTHGATTDALRSITEILEIHTITGAGDLLLRVVARSNDHLHDLLQQITAIDTVERSQTQLALHSTVERTLADVVARGPADA